MKLPVKWDIQLGQLDAPVFTQLGDSHASPANRQGSSADLSVGPLSFSTLLERFVSLARTGGSFSFSYLEQEVFPFILST